MQIKYGHNPIKLYFSLQDRAPTLPPVCLHPWRDVWSKHSSWLTNLLKLYNIMGESPD